jgi:hypothetical protein
VLYQKRPRNGVRDLNFESFLFHAPDTHHVLQTQEWQGTFRIDFHNGAYSDDDLVDIFIQRLATPFNIYKNVFIQRVNTIGTDTSSPTAPLRTVGS